MPGQPGPVYPPGQFSDWNRPSVRASWLGLNRSGDGTGENDAEPGYSVLATSDPSADETVTQTWAAIDDAGGWSPPPPARDVSAHTDGEGFPGIRTGARPAGARAPFEAVGGRPEARDPQLAPWESGALPAIASSASTAAAAGPGASGPGAAGPVTTGPVTTGSAAGRGAGGTLAGRGPGNAPADGRGSGPAPWESGSLPSAGRSGTRHGQHGGRDTGELRRHGGGGGGPGRPVAPAGRRTSGSGKRSHRAQVGLLMAPVVVVILVVAVIVYLGSRPPTAASHAAPPATHPAGVSPSPTPTLGPWKNITSQTTDPQPLTIGELFPAHYTVGAGGTRTVEKVLTKCTRAVIGSALQTAVRKAGCTQVMRASYLSASRKMMATIGVFNLVDVTAAVKAGQASGASDFVRQLPGRKGPTHNLRKGTGLEEAEVKGHYLILIWAEFANLHAPSGGKQRKELAKFSADLFSGTANVSLTSRMVTGQPQTP